MTFLTLLIIAVNTGLAIYLAYIKRRQNSPFQFFYLSLAGLTLFPGLFENLEAFYYYHPFANPVYIDSTRLGFAHLIILFYLVIFLILELAFSQRVSVDFYTPSNRFGAFYLVFVVLLFVVAFGLQYYGYKSFLYLSLTDIREGPLNTISLVVQYLLILSIPLPAFLLYSQKKIAQAVIVLLLMLLVSVIIGGSRQPIILTLTVLIAIFVQKQRYGFLWLVLLIVFGFAFLDFIMMFMKLIRNTNSIEERIDLLAGAWRGDFVLTGTSSESAVRYVMYEILFNGELINKTPGTGLLRSMLFWMPSFIDFFNIKPIDFEYELFAYIMGNRVGTMQATYFGSTFADVGWGFPAWVFYTFVVMRMVERFCCSLRSNYSFYFWAIGVYMAIMMSRGSLYAPLVVFFVAIIITYLDKIFLSFLRKR